MAGFLRRKAKTDAKQANSSSSTRDSRSSTSVAAPPLYTRFASGSAKEDDSATGSRPMVSGPMSLASARKAGPGRPTGVGQARNKGQGPDERRLMNGNGKWNGSGYDVRAQVGQSNSAASGSGYLTTDPAASSTSVSGTQPNGLSPGSRAGSGVQTRKGLVSSLIPSPASRVSSDISLPTSRAVAESLNPPSVPSSPAKDRRLSKPSIPTPTGSSSTANEYKPLPVPETASASSLSTFNPYLRQKPNISSVSYTDPPNPDIRAKENKNLTSFIPPHYPQALTQHLLSKVDKDLPPQPPSHAPTASNGSVVEPSTLNSNSQNQTPPPSRVTDPPSPRKSQFPSFSRISLSRSSPPKSQPQNVKPFPTTGHVSSKSLDGHSFVQRGFEPATALPAASGSRLFSRPRLPSVSGILSKTKDKGKGVARVEDPIETGSNAKPLDNKATHATTATPQEASSSPPRRRAPSQNSGDTDISRSSLSNVQPRKSHHQQTSSGDFWPQAVPKPNHTTSPSEFSTTSTIGSSGYHSFPSSVSDTVHSLPTRASVEPPNSTIPSNPPDLTNLTTKSTNITNPSRRSDLLHLIDNEGINPSVKGRTIALPTPPSTQQQEVRRVMNSKASHTRQTSMQMRKGPLIFASTAESEVSDPPSMSSAPNPSKAQTLSNDSQRLKSVHGDVRSGIEAYPCPPTESTSFIDGASARTRQRQEPPFTEVETKISSDQPAQDNKAKDRQTQNFRTFQSPPQPQPHPPYGTLPQSQPFPSQLPRPQIPPAQADFQSHLEHSQTPGRPQHSSTVSPYPNGHDRIPSDTQSKSRHVLTKARQATAIPRPTTPPASLRKPTKRLDPSINFDDQARRPSGIPENINYAASGLGHIDQVKPSLIDPVVGNASLREVMTRQSSKQDPSRMPDADPIVTKRRTQATMDADTDTNTQSTFQAPPTPVSPEEHLREQLHSQPLEHQPPSLVTDVISQRAASAGPYDPVAPRARPRPMTMFSMTAFSLCGFLSDAGLLFNLLSYLTFHDWIILFSISKQIRTQLQEDRELREEVLERYLETIGYERWAWEGEDPLFLSLQDLNEYMRGVSMPNHQYARLANQCLQSDSTDASSQEIMQDYTASTRAYTRVVLRLRVQAEAAEAEYMAQHIVQTSSNNGPVSSYSMPNNLSSNQSRSFSRPPSRAPSPAMSMFSNSHHAHSGAANHAIGSVQSHTPQHRGASFRSPLFKLRRAPLLRVFVPSPDGDWLSDQSVLECEAQLKRAGVLKLLRSGDVVWDVAVGDEGNVGRLIWDGKFLIDLDYSYSRAGDLPQYLHTLTFPPSYFHRVIRTSPANSAYGSNPIVHIDISPWGEEVATNLQLLQDRMRTETPQGSHHNVVRWVHRSSFVIRPPPMPIAGRYGPNRTRIPTVRIPIPQTDNLFVDPSWYGTVVVEAEGTNEGLADLQERCGTGVFPPRPRPVLRNPGSLKPRDGRKVFRLLREKSRQGEIWLRTVGEKERLM